MEYSKCNTVASLGNPKINPNFDNPNDCASHPLALDFHAAQQVKCQEMTITKSYERWISSISRDNEFDVRIK